MNSKNMNKSIKQGCIESWYGTSLSVDRGLLNMPGLYQATVLGVSVVVSH